MSARFDNRSGLSELTVTCQQCGSASMERLDRKEYRCTHCGAITVISDDDADRVEELLREALSRQSSRLERVPPVRNPSGSRAATMIILTVVAAVVATPLLIDLLVKDHSGISTSVSNFDRKTVPANQVPISQLAWNTDKKRYEGTIYNHSGYPIETPRFTMTLFTNGHRSGSTWGETELNRMLPGEYQPISFDPRDFSNDSPPDRYELNPPDSIDREMKEIARPTLTQQQLVRQEGEDWYQLVGIVRNSFTRPLGNPRILLVLYGPNREVVGSGSGYTEDLRPGENGIVDIKVYPHPKDATVASYEYIVDATFSAYNR